MTADPTPMTLYPRRSSAIWLLVVCTAFVAIGIWTGSSGDWVGFLGAAFFGLGIPVALIELIPGSSFLHIDSNGITFSNLFRKASLPWSDVGEFYVVTMAHHEMVGFNFAPTYDRARTARAVSKIIGKCEGALPDTYGKKAEDLARLLNARLQEARMQKRTTG